LLKNKVISMLLTSVKTASLSDARKRLPLDFLKKALKSMRSLSKNISDLQWKGLAVCLLDGSRNRLRPFGDIPKEFKSSVNQHKQPYWCYMQVVVCFCLRTGLVLGSAAGVEGEQIQAAQIMLEGYINTLFVGDRNFGIFRIVQVAQSAGNHVLVRMTLCRARRVARCKLKAGSDIDVTWKHSRHDQIDPNLPSQPIAGRLIVAKIKRAGFRSFNLYLFTTLTDREVYSVIELVELYGMRWHVELNIRYLKSEMDLNQLDCKSTDMAQKEWLAGLIAYNLVRGSMVLAAAAYKIEPLELSFSSSRRYLIHAMEVLLMGGRVNLDATLRNIAKCKLPKRRKLRPNEPRKKRHVRESFPPLRGSRKKARKQINHVPKS
jgi:hypothetical protein